MTLPFGDVGAVGASRWVGEKRGDRGGRGWGRATGSEGAVEEVESWLLAGALEEVGSWLLAVTLSFSSLAIADPSPFARVGPSPG